MTAMGNKVELIAGLEGDDLVAVTRVDELLSLPNELHRLEPITRVLLDLCRELREEISSGWIGEIEHFCKAARSFLEDQDSSRRPMLFSPTQAVSNPFHGILYSNPLYPVFFYTCENPELRSAYRRLLKLMLTSRISEVETDAAASFGASREPERQTLSQACRLVRKLHKNGEETSALLRKIDQFKHPRGLLTWISLGCPMEPPLQTVTYNDVRRLGQYLADCHGLEAVVNERKAPKPKHSWSSSSRKVDSVNLALWDWRKHQVDAYASGKIEQDETGMELRRLAPEIPHAARQDLRETGLLAAEFHQDSEHWLGILHSDEEEPGADDDETDIADSSASKGEIETGLPSYAKYFTAAKNRAMKFAFDNQRTATRWARPTLAEYAELLSAVDRCFTQVYPITMDPAVEKTRREDAERVRDLCLTLAVMSAFGRGFEAAHELYVLDSEAQWQPGTMEIAFLRNENRWLVGTTQLGYRSKPIQEQQKWYQDVNHRVSVPDVLGLGQWVRKTADIEEKKQPLLGRQYESQKRRFENYFSKYRKRGGRFGWSLDTLASLLSDWLDVNESPTLAGLLVPRLSQHVATQLFYTVVEASRLEQAYIGAWRHLAVGLRQEGVSIGREDQGLLFSCHRDFEYDLHSSNASIYVGSERVAIRNYFQQLVTSVKESLKTDTSRMDLIALHNEYTAYTWLFLALATASRGVHHPFEHLDEAVEIGSLHIHDKDYESGGQARVAFLPESLIDHLDGYLSWCRRLLQVIARAASSTQAGFNRMVVHSKRQTLQPAAGEHDYPAYGSLFFLNQEWHPKPATPKSVKEHLGERHPLPINAQRHMLRSYLVEQRCPEDIIDAFLGHWDRGREPWASYGVIDPEGYRQKLFWYLEPLLKTLGFESLEPA